MFLYKFKKITNKLLKKCYTHFHFFRLMDKYARMIFNPEIWKEEEFYFNSIQI